MAERENGQVRKRRKSTLPLHTEHHHHQQQQQQKTDTPHSNQINSLDDGPKQKQFSRPSKEALALSATLKELSSKKKLREALNIYWEDSNNNIRDVHHGSIIVDCCARCGAVEEAEKVMEFMERTQQSNSAPPVQAKTALLKAYAHSGLTHKAIKLYRSMNQSKDIRHRPNVRTFNTLLRGCLWTASSVYYFLNESDPNSNKNGHYAIAGGVVSGEEAWHLSSPLKHENTTPKKRRLGSNTTHTSGVEFDASSYEYSIMMLCQSLRCDEAESRMKSMKLALNLDCSGQITDPSMIESLVVSLVSLARAYALLGRIEISRQRAQEALDKINLVSESKSDFFRSNHVQHSSANNDPKRSKTIKADATGGKRSWKSSKETANGLGEENQNRSTSNLLFRTHRLSELKKEAQSLLELVNVISEDKESNLLANHIIRQLLYFSGGGTTSLSNGQENKPNKTTDSVSATRTQLLNSQWLSFGLGSALGSSFMTNEPVTCEKLSVLQKKDRRLLRNATDYYETRSVIRDDGYLDYNRIFPHRSSSDDDDDKDDSTKSTATTTTTKEKFHRPLHIELGAGFGDWIATQARCNPNDDYMPIELRADRVAQIFAKVMLNTKKQNNQSQKESAHYPLKNVCCVGADCQSFLQERIYPGTLSTIYVNHPEPPTQTYGSDERDMALLLQAESDGDEPAHMLHSNTIRIIGQCLRPNGHGRFIVVTDNPWYARFICCTAEKVLRDHPNLLTPLLLDGGNFRRFKRDDLPHANQSPNTNIVLYEGQPCEEIGHYNENNCKTDDGGSSYFDRLWRTGAGTHAQRRKRFIIALRTYNPKSDDRKDEIQDKNEPISSSQNKAGSTKPGKMRKHKKKSLAKQQRRNEKRLAKKRQLQGFPTSA